MAKELYLVNADKNVWAKFEENLELYNKTGYIQNSSLACFWIKKQCFMIDNYFVPVNVSASLNNNLPGYIAYFGRENKNQYSMFYK